MTIHVADRHPETRRIGCKPASGEIRTISLDRHPDCPLGCCLTGIREKGPDRGFNRHAVRIGLSALTGIRIARSDVA